MFNTLLQDQLSNAINTGKLKPKHFDGYTAWKKKFDHFYEITHDVKQTLDILYGPNGGVNNYRGSLYRNSNLSTDKIAKKNTQKHQKNITHVNSSALDLFKNRKI
jgi:hypothetical protein